ncbi:DUF2478 domain-containing protein [Thalassospira sp.]|uniref:DUF2478 domain-containing protein n=1 Tax=Thalassospira sp. TaxID=1912094 RepID=UPI00273531BB|nr:DUF2478 domain-containing protein [Thalassospira sp.]MDP2697194.1 DUF2478 domain-containing protein [Thalassospira sp.]
MSDNNFVMASVLFDTAGRIDTLLGDTAARLQRDGLQVAGYVQFKRASTGQRPLVYARQLATGTETAITRNNGKLASGCKLDSDALAALSSDLEYSLSDHPDILIIARFGRSEAEGRGLRDTISQALMAGIPVLVGVRQEYKDVWQEFQGGIAQILPQDPTEILQWCQHAVGTKVTC